MKTILKLFVIASILIFLALIVVLPRISNNKNLPKPQPDIPVPEQAPGMGHKGTNDLAFQGAS